MRNLIVRCAAKALRSYAARKLNVIYRVGRTGCNAFGSTRRLVGPLAGALRWDAALASWVAAAFAHRPLVVARSRTAHAYPSPSGVHRSWRHHHTGANGGEIRCTTSSCELCCFNCRPWRQRYLIYLTTSPQVSRSVIALPAALMRLQSADHRSRCRWWAAFSGILIRLRVTAKPEVHCWLFHKSRFFPLDCFYRL